MKYPHKRQKKKKTERGPREDGGRGWSDAATSPGMVAATRRWKRQGRILLLEPSEGAWPFGHLDLGLLASRTVSE